MFDYRVDWFQKGQSIDCVIFEWSLIVFIVILICVFSIHVARVAADRRASCGIQGGLHAIR